MKFLKIQSIKNTNNAMTREADKTTTALCVSSVADGQVVL